VGSPFSLTTTLSFRRRISSSEPQGFPIAVDEIFLLQFPQDLLKTVIHVQFALREIIVERTPRAPRSSLMPSITNRRKLVQTLTATGLLTSPLP